MFGYVDLVEFEPESVIRFLFIFAYMCARLGHDSSKT